jgi:hypothetical protein
MAGVAVSILHNSTSLASSFSKWSSKDISSAAIERTDAAFAKIFPVLCSPSVSLPVSWWKHMAQQTGLQGTMHLFGIWLPMMQNAFSAGLPYADLHE